MSDKTAKLLSLFNLPSSSGPPLNSFNCAYLDSNIPYQGTLYLFNDTLAFYSSLVPLHTQKLVVPYADIVSVQPARLLAMNRSIALATRDKHYFFTSFLSRDKCIASIEQLMKESGTARRRGGSREDGGEREGDGGDDAEGGASEADGNDEEGDAEQPSSRPRLKRLGVDDNERSISFVSEVDEADDDPTNGPVRPTAAKGKQSSRPNKANHRRALSSSYTVGERYAAAKDKSPTTNDGGGVLSKQERLLARNAQRIKEQKERAEREKVEAAMEELREEKEKARGSMMARLSPMNLIKTREQKEEEAARRKRREERQEWEHNTDSEEEAPEGELERGRRKSKLTKLPIRLPRKRDGEDDEDNYRASSTPSPSGEQDERIDDETSPNYIPPQPSSLYMPRAYTLADPQVTAIAARFSSLSAPLDTKNRRYIADGPVQRQGRYSVVNRHMFLFSDKLILAKAKGGGGLQMKQQCDLDTVTLDVRPVDKQRTECRETKLPSPFRVCFIDKNGRAGWWVLSVSEGGIERRRQWVKQIQLAVSRVLWVRWKEEGRQFEWGWYMKLVEGSIHLAVRNNRQDEVKDMLTREPLLVNERGQQGLSPLMVAAHVNHHQIASLLLSHDALPTCRDWDGRTAVHIAAKLGYADTLTVLLEDERVECRLYHPGKGRFSINSALWMAALSHRSEYDKCMRMIVQHCKEHKWPGASASSLLNQRDVEEHTLLETCVSLSLTDVIPIVLSLGAALDLPHPTLLITPLGLAAQRTDLDSLTTLIQLGAQPNWRDTKFGNSVLHHASSLQVASFLVAHGARVSMRNKEGTRITDIYAQNREVQTLMAAEQLYQQRKPVETKRSIKGRPRSVSANGGHALESCYLCGDGVGGLGGVMKKVGWCARCGYVMCNACLSQELIFLDDEGETVMRVCSGCYNVEMYAEETADRRKRRLERERKEAEEAKQSIFNLDYITSALTAVHISQHALPGNVLSTYHGKVQIAELPATMSGSSGSISAPAVPVDPLAAPVASRRSPQQSSGATSGSPGVRKQLSVSLVGPGANAALASVDRVVNYAAGGSITPRGAGGVGSGARKDGRLAVGSESPVDETGSGNKRGGGGLKVSASMDGVSDRMKKANSSAASSGNRLAVTGKGRSVQQRADEEADEEAEERTDDSFILLENEEHESDGRKNRKTKASPAKKPARGAGKEERKQQQQSDEEEEEAEARVVEKKGAEKKKTAGKTVLEVRVDGEEKPGKKAGNEVVKRASKRRVVEADFT